MSHDSSSFVGRLTFQDFFFCIPIMLGCPDKIKQEGDGTPYVCPRCHNAQVVEAKSRTWFELCWIPLVRDDRDVHATDSLLCLAHLALWYLSVANAP